MMQDSDTERQQLWPSVNRHSSEELQPTRWDRVVRSITPLMQYIREDEPMREAVDLVQGREHTSICGLQSSEYGK